MVLHGGWASPAATDLESRINESALAAALVTDYRNFGHGRHLWFANRSADTLVVALVTPEVRALARRTLALLPKNTSTIVIDSEAEGPQGTIELLIQCMHFVGAIGRANKADPGKPSVPVFGRKLYGLNSQLRRPDVSPVDRKAFRAPVRSESIREIYESALTGFLSMLHDAPIGAVALDYDGTICSAKNRQEDIGPEIAAELTRLVRAGISVGLATGRGDSVRRAIRRAIPDESLWKQVFIGYHNGGEIGDLSDDNTPREGEPTNANLLKVLTLLRGDSILSKSIEIAPSECQLSLRSLPGLCLNPELLLSHVFSLTAGIPGLRCTASTHSVDVFCDTTSKLHLVYNLASKLRKHEQVLSIGDRGAWPGNDFELLSSRLSLSVDESSSVADRCWNLAPSGVIGPAAALFYLKRLRFRQSRCHFDTKGLT
jgi:hydroxymethylpyrimidine pyrophosphatase-like HAD family hydrolase